MEAKLIVWAERWGMQANAWPGRRADPLVQAVRGRRWLGHQHHSVPGPWTDRTGRALEAANQ
jgi:hypothetical protein